MNKKEVFKSPTATAVGDLPRNYIGPQPAPTVSNLPCKCTLPADQLTRAQQDYVLATVPQAAAWYEEAVPD